MNLWRKQTERNVEHIESDETDLQKSVPGIPGTGLFRPKLDNANNAACDKDRKPDLGPDALLLPLRPEKQRLLFQYGNSEFKVGPIKVGTTEVEGLRKPEGWIGDNIVDAFRSIMNHRSKERRIRYNGGIRTHVFSGFFLAKTVCPKAQYDYNYSMVARWFGRTSKWPATIVDLLMFPYIVVGPLDPYRS